MHISKNIRFLRKSKGWNQSRLGELVEISNATVSSYESGVNQPGIDTVVKLAMVLEVSIDDLIFRDIEKEGTSDKPAPTSAEISDEEVMTINELMMHRIRELEREIKAENPELARKLGIK